MSEELKKSTQKRLIIQYESEIESLRDKLKVAEEKIERIDSLCKSFPRSRRPGGATVDPTDTLIQNIRANCHGALTAIRGGKESA